MTTKKRLMIIDNKRYMVDEVRYTVLNRLAELNSELTDLSKLILDEIRAGDTK